MCGLKSAAIREVHDNACLTTLQGVIYLLYLPHCDAAKIYHSTTIKHDNVNEQSIAKLDVKARRMLNQYLFTAAGAHQLSKHTGLRRDKWKWHLVNISKEAMTTM